MADQITDADTADEIINGLLSDCENTGLYSEQFDAWNARIAAALERVRREERERWRTELFALCEDTETLDSENGFNRGRKHEAKSIRRAMGEVIAQAIRATPESEGG